jgi:hypothetical protein
VATQVFYTGDGSTVSWNVTFPFRSNSDVKVSVDGVDASFTWAAPSTIQISPAVGTGKSIRVYRQTAMTNRAVDFTDGSVLTENDLDTDSFQAFNRLQEIDVQLSDLDTRAFKTAAGETGITLPVKTSRAGKFFAFDADGNPIVASGTGNDASFRTDLAGGQLTLIGAKRPGTGAVMRTLADLLAEMPATPQAFGAKGDGTTDDSAAFQAALNANKYVFVPPGQYKLASTVTLNDGQVLFGAGKSAWEPYTPSTFPAVTRSEILVNGTLAFTAAGKNSVAIRGLSIKATGGTQSTYGAAAGYQASARFIDITGSSQFEADDLSFFGLEIGVDANQTGGSSPTQMPRITNWSASDCKIVFRFGNISSAAYTVRDALIGECQIALHCNQFVDAHWCDGLRIENSRFFQAYAKSINVRATPFVNMTAVTVFESGDDQVTLDSCQYVTLAGMQLARAGAYKASTPYPSKRGLVLTSCSDVSFDGIIQQPAGNPIEISGCTNVAIKAACGSAFWTNGNATNASGAINVTNSEAVDLHASVTGSLVQVSVFADAKSARTLTGSVTGAATRTLTTDAVGGTSPMGTVRAIQLQPKPYAHVHRLAADTAVASGGGVLAIDTIRVFIPAGKVLKTRSVEMTSPTVQLRANAQTWNAAVTTDPGNGTVALDDKVLYDNTAGSDGWFSVPISLVNPSGSTVTVPAGHETRISTALV